MTLEIDGLSGNPRFRALISRRLDAAFERHGVAPVSSHVAFADENGPKGGIGIRCGITAELPRRPTLHVDHVADTQRTAFDGALEALERQVTRDRGRLREQRRRPKKYFVAKRLLEGDTAMESVRSPRQRRRSA
jgi:ribosome-associated translation inhibitor RaiA